MNSISLTSTPTFRLSMQCFWCELAGEHVILKEHDAARWLTADNLTEVAWLPADLLLIDDISHALKPFPVIQ